MLTLIIVHYGTKFARFGKEVRKTWREIQRLRRSLSGKGDE